MYRKNMSKVQRKCFDKKTFGFSKFETVRNYKMSAMSLKCEYMQNQMPVHNLCVLSYIILHIHISAIIM